MFIVTLTDNDIVFIPIKFICTVFKPKGYKLYLPTVFISQETLRYVSESKYLGFSFSDSKCDDCDTLLQMRSLYAKSNRLLCTFSHCSKDIKVTLCQSYCTALDCPFLWTNYKKSTFKQNRVAFNNAYGEMFGLPKRSSASVCRSQYLQLRDYGKKDHIWFCSKIKKHH